MHPTLFTLGETPITSYGVALSLAFAVGILVARVRARSLGLSGEVVVEVSIVILLSALIGSRLFYALENPTPFVPPEGSWSRLWSPFLKTGRPGEMAGLSMTGGVMLAVASAFAFFRWRGVPALRYADLLAPSVVLGEAITRIGCFFNGCCHGVACRLPWGVVFPEGSPASRAFGQVAVHPTQLYTSLVSLVGFGLLLALARSRWARTREGAVFFAFLVVLPAIRLGIDPLRHQDAAQRVGGDILVHQPLVIVLLTLGVAGLIRLYRLDGQDLDRAASSAPELEKREPAE